MAKLTGPLQSFSASGTIAGGLTFSQRKSGQQVRWQRKQKDVITSARTVQRDEFLDGRDSWFLYDFGIQQFGYFLAGGKIISISSLPLSKRAPKFACYMREWLGG